MTGSPNMTAGAVPAAAPAGTGSTMLTASSVFTGRAMRHVVRRPETVVQTVIFPIVLLLTMLAVFSTAVEQFTAAQPDVPAGEPYAQRLVPVMILSGIMFGSSGAAVLLFTDLRNGFFTRIRALSTPLGAPLVGISVAEAVRASVTVVTLCIAGIVAGFRFQAGWPAALGFLAVAALAAVTFTWVGLFLAAVARSMESFLPPLNALFLVLLFCSQGMVPLDAYPEAFQPFVRWNPGSAYVVLLDRLARGEELLGELLLAAGWSAALITVSGVLCVRSLRHWQSG